MTEYIPVSRDAHRKRTEYLLSLLPGKAEQTLTTKDSETDLICYPNPTTGLLSLYFSLDSDSDVEISVYDMLGKVYKRIHKPFLSTRWHVHLYDKNIRRQNGNPKNHCKTLKFYIIR